MSLHLDTPVQYIKGVGPKLASLFERRGVYKVQDLIEYYPRAYEDRRRARNIASLVPNEIVSLKAQIVSVYSVQMGKSMRKMHDVVVRDSSGQIHCKFFRIPYKGYFERFRPGQEVRVVGKVTVYRGQREFHHPDLLDLEDEKEIAEGLIPIYVETEGLSSRRMSKIIEKALGEVQSEIHDLLPQWIMKEYGYPNRFEALQKIHRPPPDASTDFAQLKSPYHERIIFEEFFWLELYLAVKRAGIQKEKSLLMKKKLSLVEKMIQSLGFQLTQAQKRCFEEIVKDLTGPHPMHRLIQGDVGSGKTIVALMSAAVAIENGYQVAIMVPTEILAEQHYQTARKWLEPLGIQVARLTGALATKEKAAINEGLQSGEIQVCLGTHALIQDDVSFKNLGLVIIDEQHRFGVHQRNDLKRKGVFPHFLVMTATPIPRTLAMTVYGDLDVSVIDELPKGRSPIVTRVVYENKREAVMDFLKNQIENGRQAYVVYPLVEESEKVDLKDAISQYEELCARFPQFAIGLLHGRMKPDEKDEVMEHFRAGMLNILVSTTVIEVGVDVANANMMIVEHAERFGLSQLHQLRGRVGRGSHKSYCVLMLGKAVSKESKSRTEIMASTNDGFKIAEADLEIRGPGEFLGARQSGLTGFKMAHLVRDAQVLQKARAAAFEVLRRDPRLLMPEHRVLREEFARSHGALALASVG